MSDLELICEICGSPAEFIEDYFGEEWIVCNQHLCKSRKIPTRKIIYHENMQLQNEKWQKMYEVAIEYYKLLNDPIDPNPQEKVELKEKLDELTIPFSDNPAYCAFLRMERIVKFNKGD